MAHEKQNWQVQTLAMLDKLRSLPQFTGVPTLELDGAMRQVTLVGQGTEHDGTYGESRGGVTMLAEANVGSDATESQRSAYRESRELRRQSERLLQV